MNFVLFPSLVTHFCNLLYNMTFGDLQIKTYLIIKILYGITLCFLCFMKSAYPALLLKHLGQSVYYMYSIWTLYMKNETYNYLPLLLYKINQKYHVAIV